MIDGLYFLAALLVMSGVTYLVRMLPLVFFRRRIRNRFVRSFLYYIPYVVLSVMTIPGIFYSTGSLCSAIVGTLVALVIAYFSRSLIIVAAGSALAVLITELLLPYLPL